MYDACHSGSFLPLLTPPEGKERIVISSAELGQSAYFTPLGGLSGGLSFSYQFWSAVLYGSELDEAFIFGKAMMKKSQTALLDADGDGIGNEDDDFVLANNIKIGRGYKPASDMPRIGSACENMTLHGETSATIWVGSVSDANGIREVVAVISRPDHDPGPSGTPVLDMPALNLEDPDGDSRYEGIYNDFAVTGTYEISVYALDTTEPDPLCSAPRQIAVIQKGRSCLRGDLSGDDTLTLTDALMALKSVAGKSAQTPCSTSGVDVNGDEKIGLEEVIYILDRVTVRE
ncbi:hypothetical protein [Desulfonema magnum]|uniref:hypothetical protein n=1 Tax=Desulfonema magnum TaxID=45655 RepID=UPI001A9C126F|nr:hypothetical protein [Desulfonema magnum]